jgi:hypothetical protein
MAGILVIAKDALSAGYSSSNMVWSIIPMKIVSKTATIHQLSEVSDTKKPRNPILIA